MPTKREACGGNWPGLPRTQSRFLLVLVRVPGELECRKHPQAKMRAGARVRSPRGTGVAVPQGEEGLSPWKPGSGGAGRRGCQKQAWTLRVHDFTLEAASEPGVGVGAAGREPEGQGSSSRPRGDQSLPTHPSSLQREFSAFTFCLFGYPWLFYGKNVPGGIQVHRIVSKSCPKGHNWQIIWGEGVVSALMIFFSFLAAPGGMRNLSSPTGIEPVPPAGEAWSPNHWATREVPSILLIFVH